MHFLDVIGLNCLFRTGFLEIMRNKEWCHNPTENRPGARRLQEHCKKSYQIMISHIPTNMILTNYLRGPGIIPDPQTRPSSFSLKPAPQTKPSKTGILKGPAPHDWPSISSANPQKLWLSQQKQGRNSTKTTVFYPVLCVWLCKCLSALFML